ncbi:Protein kinase C-like 1 [Ophidiomyces ophidiicola]|nr:Protein kinase C-like 1 [Ophidiomyces ophidiicola]
MLADKISEHKANAWLLNTGWVGAGCTTGGKRCPLKYTRAILDAIHSGELAQVEYETYDTFNLHIPKTCPNVPSELLNPQRSWTGSASFKDEVNKLADLFNQNFTKYSAEATPEVLAAAPLVSIAAAATEDPLATKVVPAVPAAAIPEPAEPVAVNGEQPQANGGSSI